MPNFIGSSFCCAVSDPASRKLPSKIASWIRSISGIRASATRRVGTPVASARKTCRSSEVRQLHLLMAANPSSTQGTAETLVHAPADLGTMQVSEEVEAIEAVGIGPLRFLVAARMLALFALMPCLSVVSSLAAIFATALISRAYFNIAFVYFQDLVLHSLLMRDIII